MTCPQLLAMQLKRARAISSYRIGIKAVAENMVYLDRLWVCQVPFDIPKLTIQFQVVH
jgi:hypothetical protein